MRLHCWGMPGHCTAQAEYGGEPHWFDPLIGAYVFRRDGKTIASLKDIAADPSLLTQAVEEGRASPAFGPCRTVLRDDAARYAKDKPEYVRECAELEDDVTDDAQVVEQAGHPVSVVISDATNLKITTKADILLANAILKSRPAKAAPRLGAFEEAQW